MYELKLSPSEKTKFVTEAKNRLYFRDMTIKALAAKIGRPVNSVYGFFNSNKKKPNRFLAAEIANELGMKPTDWR